MFIMSFLRISLFIFLGVIALGKTSEESPEATATASATTTENESVSTTPKPKEKSQEGTVQDRERLRHHLFDNYDSKINPGNVTVKFGLRLFRFDVDEIHSNLHSYVWLRIAWTDERLSYKKSDFGGQSVIMFDADAIWKPDITLLNSANSEMMKCWKSSVLIYPDGEILWVPSCDLVSMCKLTTRNDPYGEQHCQLKFGSWTYDGYAVDIKFSNDKPEMDLSDMWNSTNWELVSNKAERHVKIYDCCEQPYPDLTFNMTVKRKSDVPCPGIAHR